jgi:uncharacterized protein DUF6285
MQDRPTARELLEAVRRFLEDDVVAALDGPARFHARVAANVLGIVGRELEDEEGLLVAEWTRLATLLGRPASTPPERLAALRAAVAEMTDALCACIRRGDADASPFREAVRAAVTASVAEKLAVANPRMAR